ncbi:MAG TPA: sigma-70 family RNA polymerase sigma factor [Steroidobacteraceae bacterium]|nr:sigma-70 family RNA polymerase sigma factor [Steroidobacteraceae bacterium]
MPESSSFPDTHWSVVMLAGQSDADKTRAAMEVLFRAYWYPLFTHLRSRGQSRAEAEDLLQGFFVHLVERQTLARADRLKGAFRSFLLGCLRNFLANHREHAAAGKRGGGVSFIPLDFDAAESALQQQGPDPAADTERDFDRRWAWMLMQRALSQLESDYRTRPEVYARLKVFLTNPDDGSRAQIAAQLGMSDGAIKVAIHRLRARFRELLRAEIARTVSAPHEIDDELRHLLQVLA